MTEIITICIADILLFFLLMIVGKINHGTVDIKLDGHFSNQEKAFVKSAFGTYLLSALVQQIGCIILFTILKENIILPIHIIVLICGMFFLICHFPNPALMGWATLMEMILLPFYNATYGINRIIFIFLMYLTHSVLATSLLLFFPESFHHNFKVWLDFLKNKDKL